MATISLRASHNPLAWLLYFTKLRVTVDGEPHRLPWGDSEVPVPVGTHTVEISFGYMGSQRGKASTTVTATDAAPVRLRYKMPSWMFASGRLSIEGS